MLSDCNVNSDHVSNNYSQYVGSTDSSNKGDQNKADSACLTCQNFWWAIALTNIRLIIQSNKKSKLICNADQVAEVSISITLTCNRLIKA